MNTKQLWYALIKNVETESYFDGVFSIDLLQSISVQPKLIICNTDPSFEKGEHWVLFFFPENNIAEFYDPLGRSLNFYDKEFGEFISKYSDKYMLSSVRTQPYNSNLCGEYCLYYALNRCKGKSMDEIIKSIPSSDKVVSFVETNFCICTNSKCSLLQECKKQ